MSDNTHSVKSALTVLCAVFAFWLIWWTTPYGPGISPDSIVYLSTARNILAGNGFFTEDRPMTHYPPAYPLLLAASRLAGSDALQSARWLHAVLFAINAVLIGILAYVSARKNLIAAISAVILFLSHESMLDIHTMAWSEPLFITFSLAAVIVLVFYLSKPRFMMLIATGIFLGLALSTRYVGITLLPPMMLGIFLFADRPRKAKIQDSLILLLTGAAPLMAWLIRNFIVADTAANRKFLFHPITLPEIEMLFNTLYDFWFPLNISNGAKIAVVLSACILVMGIFKRVRNKPENAAQTILIVFCITYLVFLFFSISFIDAATPLDGRILSPVYVFGTILVISLFQSMSILKESPMIWKSFVVICLIVAGINTNRMASWAALLHNEDGRGYNNSLWRDSQSLGFVRSLPKGVLIYSNGPDVIGFITERNAKMIPHKISSISRTLNPDFRRDWDLICKDVMLNKAVIIYLYNITWRWYLPVREQVPELCEMPASVIFEDGIVYIGKELNKSF